MICYQCKKNFREIGSTALPQHLKKCYKNIECDNAYIHNALLVYDFLTYDFLYHQYIELRRSPKIISKCFLSAEDNIENKTGGSIGRNIIDKLLTYYNIPKRNIKQAASCDESKTQRENTNLKKYGGINPLSGSSICREKAISTIQEKYGVDNVFKVKNFDAFFNVNDAFIKKYGITKTAFLSQKNKKWLSSLTEQERNDFFKRTILSHEHISKIEQKVASSLILNGIAIETQFAVPKIHKKTGSQNSWYFDIKIKDTNLLIEVNGDYWHGNPNKYLETDINSVIGCSYKQIWEQDSEKKADAEKKGYKVIYLWETDINHNTDDLFNFILEELQKQGGILNENITYQINNED